MGNNLKSLLESSFDLSDLHALQDMLEFTRMIMEKHLDSPFIPPDKLPAVAYYWFYGVALFSWALGITPDEAYFKLNVRRRLFSDDYLSSIGEITTEERSQKFQQSIAVILEILDSIDTAEREDFI